MKILVICSSNTCRSPYAEFILKRLVNESDVLKSNIESVTSSAVFNQSRTMHPKTRALLLEEGFSEKELDSFKPDFILKNKKKFEEADVIIGMGLLQWFLLPIKYHKKYVNLSYAAVGKNINIPDPFYRKSMEFYKKTMDVIKTYLVVYAEKLEKEFSKKD